MNVLTILAHIISSFAVQEKVVIIGSGPSGIAAATRLLENGYENLLLLEAEPRIGGRVNTINLDGKRVDMGAEWCHGQKNNVVYEIMDRLKLLELLQHDDTPTQIYVSSRANITYELSKELIEIIENLALDEDFQPSRESFGTLLTNKYNEIINKKYRNNKVHLKYAQWSMHILIHGSLSLEGAFSLDDVGTNTEYLDCPGDHMLGWKTGYSTILDILMKKYPNPKEQLPIDDKLLLNKEVTKIMYDTNDFGSTPVKILCSDNTEYTAKHVIVTTSVGVLKASAKNIFQPQLPHEKIRSIKNIGFGGVLKVFLSFERKWWGDLSGFNFIWTDSDKRTSRENFPYGPRNRNGESWIVEHYSILAMQDSNVLLVWFTGEMVPLIEKMDEKILKDGILYTINLFLGHLYYVPEPKRIVRSSWVSNPHFRGTYSFASINSTADDIIELQKPILNSKGEPLVQFAGEATNVFHHSTVHGAIETGYREADRILEHYHKKPKNKQ